MSHPDYEIEPKHSQAEVEALAADDGYSLYESSIPAYRSFETDDAYNDALLAAANADDYSKYQEYYEFNPSRTYGYSNSMFL